MRVYLRYVIRVSNITVGDSGDIFESIHSEGIIVIEDLLELYDEGIKTFCKYICKPGGNISDPDNANARITNQGINTTEICEKHLKPAVYATKIYTIIGRGLTNDSTRIIHLRLRESHKKLIEDHIYH